MDMAALAAGGLQIRGKRDAGLPELSGQPVDNFLFSGGRIVTEIEDFAIECGRCGQAAAQDVDNVVQVDEIEPCVAVAGDGAGVCAELIEVEVAPGAVDAGEAENDWGGGKSGGLLQQLFGLQQELAAG